MSFYSLFGNCQAAAMRWLLGTCAPFIETHDLVELPASYQMDAAAAQNFCEKTLPNLDLLFMHPHTANRSAWHDHNRISSLAQENGLRLVKFPQIYWNAYNRFEVQLSVVAASHDDQLIYTDLLMMQSVLDDQSHSDFEDELVGKASYLGKVATHALTAAFDAMDKVEKERGCEFSVSEFLRANHASQRLMHNNNHPTEVTMNMVCNGLLRAVDPAFSTSALPDLFPNHDTIIYPFVRDAQGLSFGTESSVREARHAHYSSYVGSLPQEDISALRQAVDDELAIIQSQAQA